MMQANVAPQIALVINFLSDYDVPLCKSPSLLSVGCANRRRSITRCKDHLLIRRIVLNQDRTVIGIDVRALSWTHIAFTLRGGSRGVSNYAKTGARERCHSVLSRCVHLSLESPLATTRGGRETQRIRQRRSGPPKSAPSLTTCRLRR